MNQYDCYSVSKVLPLNDNNYPLLIESIIQKSCYRIWITMFFVEPSLHSDTQGEVKKMIRKLASAARKNVDVRLLIDKGEGALAISRANRLTYMICQSFAIPCKFYEGRKSSMHSKYLLCDDDICIIGGHNFSPGAFNQHHESSVLLQSRDICSLLSNSFIDMWNSSL